MLDELSHRLIVYFLNFGHVFSLPQASSSTKAMNWGKTTHTQNSKSKQSTDVVPDPSLTNSRRGQLDTYTYIKF